MTATTGQTAFVVLVCLTVALGATAVDATSVTDPGVMENVETNAQTVDEINITFDPKPATTDDEVTVTAELLDADDNPVGGETVTFSKNIGTGELTSSSGTTDANGIVETTYLPSVDDIGGSVIISAESEDGTVQGSSFEVVPSADNFRNETAVPDPVDPGNETDIAARVFNESDAPFEGAAVTFSVDDGAGTITAVTQDTSDADGWVNATYEAVAADAGETVTINVTADETDANTTIPVTVTANTAGFDNVTSRPATPAADQNVTVTARVLDESNDPLVDTNVSVESDGSGRLVPMHPESNATGYIETTYVPASADNGTDVRITLAPRTDAETSLTVPIAAVTITEFTNEAAPTTIDPGETATVSAVAEDEFGDPIAGETVDIETNGTGTLNTTQADTDANGRLAVNYTATATDAGSDVRINLSAAETAAETNVTVSVEANADTIRNVSVDPLTQDPGKSVAVTAEVRDEADNPLQSAAVSFSATVDGDITDVGTFESDSTISNASGEVNTTFTPSDAVANRTVTIEVSADATDASNTTALTVTANPTAIAPEPADPDPVDPGNETAISAQVLDESGSPLPDANVSFETNSTVSVTVDRNTSDANGWVNATYTAADVDAGTTIGVDIEADDNDSVTGTVVFDVTANPTTFGNETTDPETPEPGTETTVSTRVFDESGAELSGANVTVDIASGTGTLSEVPGESNADGWINASYTPNGTDANTTVDITVEANATDADTTISFEVAPRAATEFNRTVAVPDRIDPFEAVGSLTNESTIAVQVLDQVGDELADAEIDFSVVDGTGNGELNTTTMTTNADGWANVTYSAVGDDANTTVEIDVDAVDRAVSDSVRLEVAANPTTFTNETVAPETPEPNESTDLAVRLRDESGTPLADAGVELTVTDGNSSLENVPTTSNDEGWINATYTPAGTDATRTVEITVEANETDATTTISFGVDELAAAAFNRSLAAPAEIDPIAVGTRDNETTAAVRVLDQVGDVLGGASVEFNVTDGNGSLGAEMTTSTADGWANVTYSAVGDDANTTVRIEANATGRDVTETITVEVTANPTEFTDASATPAAPEPNESTTIVATVLDESDDPLADTAIEFTTNGSADFESTETMTDASGQIAAVYIPASGDANSTVDVGIVATESEDVFTNVTFAVDPLAASGFANVTVEPAAIDPVDTGDRTNETNLSAQVLDQFGQPLKDAVVTFDDDGFGDLVDQQTTSSADGWVNATYVAASDDANSTVELTINATDREAETSRSVDVTANPDSFDRTDANPDPVDPTETTTVHARVLDESGDPLSGETVEFVVTDGKGTVTGGGTTATDESNASGYVETVYDPVRDDANTTVDIGLEAVETGTTTNVTVEIDPLVAETIAPEPADPAEIDPVDTGERANRTTLSAQVLDQFGQPLKGANVTFTHDGSGTLTVDRKTSDPAGWVNATYAAGRNDAGGTVEIDIDANDTDASATIAVDVTANPDSIDGATATPATAEPDESVVIEATVVDESDADLESADVTFSHNGSGTLTSSTDTSDTNGLVSTTYDPDRADANGTVEIEITADKTGVNTTVTFDIDPLSPVGFDNERATPDPVDPGNETALATRVLDEFDQTYEGGDITDPFEGANVSFGLEVGNGTLTADRTTNDAEGWVNATYVAANADADTEVVVNVTANQTGVETEIRFDVSANPTTFTNTTVTPAEPEPAEQTTVAVRVRDESGDPLSNAGVELNVTDGNSTLGSIPSESDANGWVNATYTPAGTDANRTVDITVEANETDAATTISFEVADRAADSFARTVAVPAEINPFEAVGSLTNESTIAVQVLDQVDEKLADAEINFSVVDGTGDGELNTTTMTTNTDGWANVTYSAVDTDADSTVSIDVDAVNRTVSDTVDLRVTANPTSFTNTTVDPGMPEPNESTTVAVRVRDESGDPLGNAGIELNVTDGNSTLENVPTESEADGWINATYTPAGTDATRTVDIEVTANETDATTTISFGVDERAADAFNRTVADPAEIDPIALGDRSNETTIGVQVLDQVREELGGAAIEFDVTSGEGRLSTTTTTSNTDGWANVTYFAVAEDANQTVYIEANATDRMVDETITVEVAANPTTFTNTTVDPEVPEPNESTTVAVRVRDESGTPLADAGVELNVTDGNSTLESVPTVSDADGWINATYTPAGTDATRTVEITIEANETDANTTISFPVDERAADSFTDETVGSPKIDPVDDRKRTNTTEIAARVLDQVGESLAGANVSFELDAGNGTLTDIENESSAEGWVNATYVANRTDADTTVEITINATDRDAETSVTVEVTPNPDRFVNVNAEPGTEPNETVEINATVLDESGTELGAVEVTVTANSTGSVTSPTVTSNAAGLVETGYEPVRGDANRTVTVTLNATATTAETTVAFEVPPLAATSIIDANATPESIDPGNETVINATVRDQFDQSLDGADVEFSHDGAGELTADRNTSVDGGVVNATYRAAATEANTTVTVTIDAVDRSVTETVSFDVTANPTSFTNTTIAPGMPEPNESTDLAVRVRDESGTPLADANVELTTTSDGAFGTIPSASDDDGWINTTYTPAGTDATTTVDVEVTANETDAATTISFEVADRAAESFTGETVGSAEIDPVTDATRDNTTKIAARVLDQVGESLGGAPVAVELDAGNGTLLTAPSESATDGWVNTTYEANRTDANTTVEITINATGRDAETTLSVDVTANPDEFTALTASPATVDPGDTTTISATVVDEAGRPLEGADVAFNTTNGTASVVAVENASLADGTVEATYTAVEGDQNESVEIRIEANQTGVSTTTVVDVNRLKADAFRNVGVAPDPADPGEAVTITAEVIDSLSQTIAGEAVDFETNGSGSLEAVASTSEADGTIEATYTPGKSDAGETVALNITANETAANTTVSLAVNELAIESFANDTVAPAVIDPVGDGPRDNEANLSVRALDQVGDPLSDAPVDIEITAGNGSLPTDPAESDTDGWINVTYRAVADDANTTAEIAINATGSDAETTLSVDVRANPDDITALTVPAEVDPGNNASVSLVVVDESDDPFEGAAVEFIPIDSSSRIVPGNVTSESDGSVSSTFVADANDAGDTATILVDGGEYINEFFNVEITENADAFQNVTLAPEPVDPNGTATISAEVLNERGEQLDGATIAFETDGAGDLSLASATSDAEGSVSTSYEPARADADSNVTVTINATDTDAETNVTVVVSELEAVELTNGSSTPDRIEPGETATVNATVRDQFGEPLVGANVTFETDATGSLTPVHTTSQANGTVAATFRPTAEENATIDITANGTGAETNVTVQVLELQPTTFDNTTATPTEITAGNRTHLSARVRDQLDAPFSGANVTIETDGNGTLGSNAVASNATGFVNTTYSADVSDINRTVTIDFESVNGTATTSVDFDVRPTPQGFENVSVVPRAIQPNETATITADVLDERNDPLAGANVTFETDSAGSFTVIDTTSDENGSIETSYEPARVDADSNVTVTIVASETGVETNTTINVTELLATSITEVELSATRIYPGDNVTVSATIRDQLTEPLAGVSIAFNASGNGTLSAANDTTGPNGDVRTVYSSVGADANSTVGFDLSAVNGTLNASATVTVRPTRPVERSSGGSGGDNDDTEIIVRETDEPTEPDEPAEPDETADSDETSQTETDIQGTETAVRVENPPTDEPVSLNRSTTGLRTLSETTNTSLEGVSVSVTDEESYWINSTTYDYEGLRVEATQSGTAQQSVTETGATETDTQADSSQTEAFVDFERAVQRVPIGYLQVDTTAAPESVERVVFEYRIAKSSLDTAGVEPAEIELYRKGETGWGPLETRHLRENATHHWFESESPGLSVFPIGTDRRPVVLSETVLSTPRITSDEQATVSVEIDNSGLLENTTQLTLSADGEVVDTTSVTIPPGESTTAELAFAPPTDGTYDLVVNGQGVGKLTVDMPESTGVIEPIGDLLPTDDPRQWVLIGLVVLVVGALWRRR